MSILQNMPSTAAIFSMCTTFTASAMLLRAVVKEVQNLTGKLMSQKLQHVVLSRVDHLFGNLWPQMTVIVDEYRGMSINEIYGAFEAYLSTRISPSTQLVNLSRLSHEQNINITVNKRENIIDVYDGITIKWKFISKSRKGRYPSVDNSKKKRSIRLSFQKKYKDAVLGVYLPHVMERSKAMKEENKVVKLYSSFHGGHPGPGGLGPWRWINLNHPFTFDKLALDPGLKKDLIDDLDQFLKRKDYYRRVGKAWKRGYLLHGPPGTGKSSLIAAMANYLKFDIYDLELTNIQRNSDLRGILTSTGNCSILVIEDVDCSIKLQDEKYGNSNGRSSQLTLSGLLNFIDGLWSSCGDGRIIVFTTNCKDKLDPALLRPGRMDVHIHMSYCNPSGFRILASNYLSLKSHRLFPEIEDLLVEVEVTPAVVAEELMKSEDADIALAGLVGLLRRRKVQRQEEGLENKAVEEEVVAEVEAKAGKKRATECGEDMGRRRKRVAVG